MKIAVCAMVKDEPDLQEWVDWHLRTGFDRLFIYDNGSRVPIPKFDDRVVVERYAGKGVQVQIYNKCLLDHGKDFDWIAFIDADEFIVTMKEPIKAMLADYMKFGGLVMPWRIFGSNGHLTRQPSMIDAYTRRMPFTDNTCYIIKSIVRPSQVAKYPRGHYAHYIAGQHAVDEWFNPVPTGRTHDAPIKQERIALFHYFLRSREDMEAKCARGWGFCSRQRTMAELEVFDARCTVEDTTLKDMR